MASIFIYDYIAQNNRKTFWLVLLFPVALLIMIWIACFCAILITNNPDFIYQGYSLLPSFLKSNTASILTASSGYTFAFAVPAFVVALIWMAVSYCFGDSMMMAFSSASPLQRAENLPLYRAVENVAIMAGLPTPKIYVIQDSSLNAFATGKNPQKASIAFTTGILEKLSPLELQGVIAHEMSHIGNRDIRLNMLIITGVGIFGLLAQILLRTRISSRENKNKGSGLAILIFFVGLACFLFNCIVAPLIQLAISRTREYTADATGAKIIHNPKALADALEKIATDSRVEALDKQKSMAIACIASPLQANLLTSTHPPITERIRRLRNM